MYATVTVGYLLNYWRAVHKGNTLVGEKSYTLLVCYAASSGNLLMTYRSDSWGFLNPESGTDRLSRNVDYKLPLLAA
jgi:hypothetical protein